MKINMDINKNQVYKWKSHLNVRDGQKEYILNYAETYPPIVHWFDEEVNS